IADTVAQNFPGSNFAFMRTFELNERRRREAVEQLRTQLPAKHGLTERDLADPKKLTGPKKTAYEAYKAELEQRMAQIADIAAQQVDRLLGPAGGGQRFGREG